MVDLRGPDLALRTTDLAQVAIALEDSLADLAPGRIVVPPGAVGAVAHAGPPGMSQRPRKIGGRRVTDGGVETRRDPLPPPLPGLVSAESCVGVDSFAFDRVALLCDSTEWHGVVGWPAPPSLLRRWVGLPPCSRLWAPVR